MESPEPQSDLPVVNGTGSGSKPSRQPTTHRFRALGVHFVRVMLIAIILLVLRQVHWRSELRSQAQRLAPPVEMALLKPIFPDAAKLTPWDEKGMARILDADQRTLGSLLHTANESKELIGYVGSTWLLIIFDQAQKIAGIRILASDDTPEHVQLIREDPAFLKSWDGLTWNQAAKHADIDSVSGATLTSLCIIRTIRARLGNPQPSLKFPAPVGLAEVKPFFPDALRIRRGEPVDDWFEILDQHGSVIGFFLRSSPAADAVHGFQGPTDFLAFFDNRKKLLRMAIRSSFDNSEPEPFVRYVQEDDYFLAEQFQGKTLEELSAMDTEQVEGVSGATMTSDGIIRALQHLAAKVLEDEQRAKAENEKPGTFSWLRFGIRDAGALTILLLAFLMAFSRLRRIRRVRVLFQSALVGYLGFYNGDLLSQLLFYGWATNGVPWSTAIGILSISLAAILVPVFSRTNLYCHHICPFGAAQSLVGRMVREKKKLPRGMHRWLKLIPGILIGLIFLSVLLGWDWNLSMFEPFDAFNPRVAGWASILIAVAGLGASVFYPQAYCKYGCPTGAMLEYLRGNRRSDRIDRRDLLAIGLLGIGLVTLSIF